MRPFLDLDQGYDRESYDHYMAVLLVKGRQSTRIIIDFRDKNSINTTAYEWCDIYGKMNLNSKSIEKNHLDKLVPTGPVVAPRIWGFSKTAFMSVLNYARCWRHSSVSLRKFLEGYNHQLKRPRIEEYHYLDSDDRYVFFDSTLWVDEPGASLVNEWRARFIRICRQSDLEFQGGLFSFHEHPEIDKFQDVLSDDFVSQTEYMKRIKRSTMVFNTPSLHGGHGWKFGEFLSMGKAILSTRILNDMPHPLEHGKNIHFVSDEAEMKAGIETILNNPGYRKKLEQGALEYYKTYLMPEKQIQRLINSHLN